MAIPFNVPNEEQPAESDWVVQFQMIFKRNILNLLNEMAQIRDTPSTSETSTSSTNIPNSEINVDTNPLTSTQSVRTDLDWLSRQSAGNERTRLNLHLLLFSTLNGRNNPVTASAHTQIPSTRRPRRQRTTSESSCCEESKNLAAQFNEEEDADIEIEQEWAEVGLFLRKIVGEFQTTSIEVEESLPLPSRPKHRCKQKQENSSILSKFMPTTATTIKSSIWTAVICVIGWHLFRAR